MNKQPNWLYIGLAILVFLTGCARASFSPEPTADRLLNTIPATYFVQLNPGDFAQVVDNPYFPLLPGSRWIYAGNTDEGVERIEVEVLEEKRVVMGIPATVVRDQVFLNGQLVEDTLDWYAQDKHGDVWYLGEQVKNFKNGALLGDAGSWEAGVDGALPGIIMFADPSQHLGETYRQEYYPGVAEDMAELVSANTHVSLPYGGFENVVETRDFTPLEPGLEEFKYYASGKGLIKEVNLVAGEELVLIEFSSP